LCRSFVAARVFRSERLALTIKARLKPQSARGQFLYKAS
jgi:hypothetical protein